MTELRTIFVAQISRESIERIANYFYFNKST